MKMRSGMVALLIVVLQVAVPRSARAQPSAGCEEVEGAPPEITYCIDGRFVEYWNEQGGLPIFGYPKSAPENESNRDTGMIHTTQWFERNRFEDHSGELAPPYNILLGRLGDELLRRSGVFWEKLPRENGAQPDCLWFQETGRNVCDQAPGQGFKSYWEANGLQDPSLTPYQQSLLLFGLPLTNAQMETNSSGDTVLTQWFERARFEWHPENPAEYRVLLGLLGNEMQDELDTTITISPSDLDELREPLREFGLVPQSVYIEKTTSLVLPCPLSATDCNSVAVLSAPLSQPPTTSVDALFAPGSRVPVAVFQTKRPVTLLDSTQLPEGIYLLVAEDGVWYLVPGRGKALVADKFTREETRWINRVVAIPEVTITIQDFCFAWSATDSDGDVSIDRSPQFCLDAPSPSAFLTSVEQAAIQEGIQSAVGNLLEANLLVNEEEISDAGAISVAEGEVATAVRAASLIVAPAAQPFGQCPDEESDGVLLGVLNVLLPIDTIETSIPPGTYTVCGVGEGDQAVVRLLAPNDVRLTVPAQWIEVRGRIPGQPDEALAVVGTVCLLGWCWF